MCNGIIECVYNILKLGACLSSHRLHLKRASRYGIPEDIASEVNRLIDYEYGVHDLGEMKRRYLGTGIIKIPLGPDVTVYELKSIA